MQLIGIQRRETPLPFPPSNGLYMFYILWWLKMSGYSCNPVYINFALRLDHGSLEKSYFLCPIVPTAPDGYVIFLSPLPKDLLCRIHTSPHGQSKVERTPYNPGLATRACASSKKSILWQW